MLTGVRETSAWTAALIGRIRDLLLATDAHVRAILPRLHSNELIQTLFTYPYVRIANVVDAQIAKRQTAADYLQRLAELGVLDPVRSGREKLFLNRRLPGLLAGESAHAPFGPV